LVGEADRATCLAVSADEAIVALGTYRGDVLVYSAGSGGRPIQQIRVGGRVRAVALSTTGRVVAAAVDDGGVVLVPLKG
ncbi:MAG TPA: hypothetical protein VKE74_19245, partial [Gemmataceae bacterium]|nr:hypothetical protein [Gemmataceae bacterium]